MEEMETLRWLRFTRPDTKMFVSRTRIMPSTTDRYPEGIEDWLKANYADLRMIDADGLVKKIESPKYLNTLVLGLAAEFLPFEEPAWRQAISGSVPPKTLEKNLDVFRLARSLIGDGSLS
jgi:indolepyruvate ferredoxin oxidoreductase beta subunit